MTWLLAHMWIVLAAASLVALILGWSVRGMMLSGKLRQSIVERDMVRVELGTAREEVEKLFAQIKKLSAGETAAAPAPDPILGRKVDSLTAELARKSAEIEMLKAGMGQGAPGAPNGSAPPEESLAWRNRHLESRVTHLESELAKAQAAAPLVAPPAADAPASPDAAKLDWEVKYLRTRVEALQSELSATPVALPPAAPAPAAPAPVIAAVQDVAAPVEEEISRLRWRVRFLEGRLAYFEGEAPGASGPVESDAPAPASVSKAILDQLEAADERAEAAAAEPVRRIRPAGRDKPADGKAHDLTLIGGIGPKIQDVLNSLGIFHFDQIADWTPENIAWVDEYLSFSGRITREGWIEQAAVLVGETANA